MIPGCGGPPKMGQISQSTLWNRINWMKIMVFLLKFNRRMFFNVYFIISEHLFTWWDRTGECPLYEPIMGSLTDAYIIVTYSDKKNNQNQNITIIRHQNPFCHVLCKVSAICRLVIVLNNTNMKLCCQHCCDRASISHSPHPGLPPHRPASVWDKMCYNKRLGHADISIYINHCPIHVKFKCCLGRTATET